MATPKQLTGGHWYQRDGTPMHWVDKKDGSGTRPTTLSDARKLGLLPSVTTVCKVLDKPALNEWRIKNAIEATLTTPRLDGESLDDFAARVMEVDTESVSDAAKQLGTDVHDNLELAINGKEYDHGLDAHILPVMAELTKLGRAIITEKSLVGDGYAGRVDLVMEGDSITVVDFKTTGAKKLPTKSYAEHKLQLAAYAATLGNTGNLPIQTANIYISTVRPGELSICINDNWQDDFETFQLVLKLWQKMNNYKP